MDTKSKTDFGALVSCLGKQGYTGVTNETNFTLHR